MDKIQFKAKFFGTKERKGQIKKQAEFSLWLSVKTKLRMLSGYRGGKPYTA